LKLAAAHRLGSISFPSISTGIYGYPVDKAAKVALDAVVAFLRDKPNSLEKVYFVLYDSKTFDAYSAKLTEVTG
jgi:O-acetyl-ADP-ribose deacetylase (regulator of RNase III)